MTSLDFGLELEFLLPANNAGAGMTQTRLAEALTAGGVACQAVGYNHHRMTTWKVVSDGSLRPGPGKVGFELVSPPLNENGLEQVNKVCEVLHALQATVNRSCGLHVHIGVRGKPFGEMIKLAEIYREYQSVIDTVMPNSRRGDNNTYCQRLPECDLSRVTTHNELNFLLTHRMGGRYCRVNFSAFERHGTVEFRQHSATIDANKIIKWVVLLNALMETAKKEASNPAPLTGSAQAQSFQAAYWRSGGRRRRTLYGLLTRPEGVTRLELRDTLQLQHLPRIREQLVAAGYDSRSYGRRAGHEIFRIAPNLVPSPSTEQATQHPITLDGLCARLELADEEKDYWKGRAASLAAPGEAQLEAAE